MRSPNTRRPPSHTRLFSALALALLALPTAPAFAQARGELPRAGVVVGGAANATISYNPGQLDSVDEAARTTITQSVKGAIINWGSFSIGRQNATTFNAVNFTHLIDGGVTLNRVVGFGNGPALSTIAGALNAPNGSVFLVNPAGVTFAAGSVTNVGGLVASTLAISNASFLAGVDSGRFTFGSATDPSDQAITVEDGASITVNRTAGRLALIGSDVTSNGNLIANGGSIGLTAGQQVTLDPFGDGLTQFTVDIANGGQVMVTGLLQAQTLGNQRGRITLEAGDTGNVSLGNPDDFDGVALDVTGNDAGERGGDIALHGDNVVVTGRWVGKTSCDVDTGACALLDASGNVAGGSITLRSEAGTGLGGGYDENPTQTAVRLLADASGVAGTGGRITLDNAGLSLRGPGDTQVLGDVRLSASGYGVDGTGGTVSITNANGDVLLQTPAADDDQGFSGSPTALAFGGRTGGRIDLQAAGLLQAGTGTLLQASGGSTGGEVTTDGFSVDLRGLAVSAGGGTTAGSWQVHSTNDLAIVDGLTGFGADGDNSLVSDDSIAGALSNGSSVTITAQDPDGPRQINLAPGVEIVTGNTIATDFTLATPGGQIIAGYDVDGARGAPWQIQSLGAPLNVTFNARSTVGLYGGSINSNGGTIGLTSQASTTLGIELADAALSSNGGDVTFDGGIAEGTGVTINTSSIATRGGRLSITGASSGSEGMVITDSTLETQDTGGDGAMALTGTGAEASGGVYLYDSALRGGQVDMRGIGSHVGLDGGSLYASGPVTLTGTSVSEAAGVQISNGDIQLDNTALVVEGTSGFANGVAISDTGIALGRGGLSITGTSEDGEGMSLDNVLANTSGSAQFSGRSIGGNGVRIADSNLALGALQAQGSGATGVLLDDAVIGIGPGSTGAQVSGVGTQDGVVLANASRFDSASGQTVIGGYSSGNGNGIRVEAGSSVLAGAATLMLRAGSAGGTALVLDDQVSSAQTVNLRSGRDDGAGNVIDDTSQAMVLGGTFTSIASLGQVTATDLVIGHAGQAGAITLAGNLLRTTNLTLQNDGGAGGIALNGAVATGDGTLMLSSGGNITQTAAGNITAHSLLVRAGGDVALGAAQNHLSGDTLAGSAGGDFTYVDTGALAIGAVGGTGVLASGTNAAVSLNGIGAGGDVLVRNTAGNLTLRGGVSGSSIDLVTAGTLQNLGNAALTAGNWRVWASTWQGETRGALLGSGTRPNLFNCSYAGACGVTVPGTDDHFIYTAQPTLAVTINDATREYGLGNPGFTFGTNGLVFADDAAGQAATGSLSTSAGVGSNVGSYAIDGSFVSDTGYALQIDPGVLAITPATLTYTANPLSTLLGQPLGTLTGSVSGFRNGDTAGNATTGTLVFTTDGGVTAPGVYSIFGSGLNALNYTFVQAPANLTALQITFAPNVDLPDLVRLPPDNYLYDLNLGMAPICPAETPLGMRREQDGDTLGREWARVRSRPNLSSCVSSERENGCGDF